MEETAWPCEVKGMAIVRQFYCCGREHSSNGRKGRLKKQEGKIIKKQKVEGYKDIIKEKKKKQRIEKK
jgi:hypothetical protein